MNKRLEDNKEVGTIVNNKAVFLELKFEADLTTGDVDTNASYDTRVIDKSKQKLLMQYINEFVEKIPNLSTMN